MNLSFHSIRHIAALLVIIGHSFELTMRPNFGVVGDPMRVLIGTETLGGAGVIIFFSVSGYLVTLSLLRSINVVDFLWKRALRIIPAFWVVLVVCALVLGPVFSEFSLEKYFSNRDVHRYLIGMFLKLGETLPGVFSNNPHSAVVNGSLWSLPIEVKCYLMLAAMFAFGAAWFRRFFFCALLALLVTIVLLVARGPINVPIFRVDSILFVKLVAPFFLGVAVALWIPKRFLSAALASIALFVVSALSFSVTPFQKWAWFFFAISLAWLVLSIGIKSEPYQQRYDGIHRTNADISYGLYLWAFPVQQALIYKIPGISFFGLLFGTLVIVVPIAYASWRLVEQPMLAEKEWLSKTFPLLNGREKLAVQKA
jgi:peptidoglycan/LPS O-acetylase OafA/YrhL